MWYLHHKIPWIVKYYLFVILCFTVLDIFRSHKGDKTSELIASLGSAWRAPPLRPCATFLVIGEESLQWFCGSCNDVDLLIPTVYQCSLDGARDALPQFLGVVEGYLAPVKGFSLVYCKGEMGVWGTLRFREVLRQPPLLYSGEAYVKERPLTRRSGDCQSI